MFSQSNLSDINLLSVFRSVRIATLRGEATILGRRGRIRPHSQFILERHTLITACITSKRRDYHPRVQQPNGKHRIPAFSTHLSFSCLCVHPGLVFLYFFSFCDISFCSVVKYVRTFLAEVLLRECNQT